MNFETWVVVASHISWLSLGKSSSDSKSSVTWEVPRYYKGKTEIHLKQAPSPLYGGQYTHLLSIKKKWPV